MDVKKMFKMSLLGGVGLVILTGLFGGLLEKVVLLEDQGPSWYYWKLPEKELLPRLTAWLGYFVHQILIWYGIYKLQSKKDKSHKWNTWMLSMNLIFVVLHFLQTHLFYDGLAQDVPVFSSQGSVIGMLVLIIIMENKKRGIIFGKKLNGFKAIQSFIIKYHGYYIAWAITYTFWYHPMVSTSGHLVGFFYLFLLFIQASFAKTKIHTMKYWIFTLEVLVLFHGTTVAIGQANNMWPMFGFGFGFIAVFTQIYSLNLKKIQVTMIQVLYILGALIVFGGGFAGKSISDIHQITWIPVIEYLLVFVLVFFGQGILKLTKNKITIRDN